MPEEHDEDYEDEDEDEDHTPEEHDEEEETINMTQDDIKKKFKLPPSFNVVLLNEGWFVIHGRHGFGQLGHQESSVFFGAIKYRSATERILASKNILRVKPEQGPRDRDGYLDVNTITQGLEYVDDNMVTETVVAPTLEERRLCPITNRLYPIDAAFTTVRVRVNGTVKTMEVSPDALR
ncbi:MAG: hypothetical protein WBK76_00535 [Candidatus Saccharimonadales bacterium]